jgi:hypothetical protein
MLSFFVSRRGVAAVKMFIQRCRVTPAIGNSLPPEIIGGHAMVWIYTDDQDRIEDIARDHLFKSGWMIEEYGDLHGTTEALVRDDPELSAFFRKAIRFGTAAEIACFKRFTK